MRRAGELHGIWYHYAYDTIVADVAEERAEERCWVLVGVNIAGNKKKIYFIDKQNFLLQS